MERDRINTTDGDFWRYPRWMGGLDGDSWPSPELRVRWLGHSALASRPCHL